MKYSDLEVLFKIGVRYWGCYSWKCLNSNIRFIVCVRDTLFSCTHTNLLNGSRAKDLSLLYELIIVISSSALHVHI